MVSEPKNGLNGHVRGGNAGVSTADQLAAIIEQNPGLNIQEITDLSHVTRTAVSYALRTLIKDQVVVTERVGRHVLHFRAGVPAKERNAFCLLRIESTRALLDELFLDPRFSWQSLSDRLLISTRTARRAVRRLEQGDLVHVHTTSKSRFIAHIDPEIRAMLARWKGPEARRLVPPALPAKETTRAWLLLLPALLRRALLPV